MKRSLNFGTDNIYVVPPGEALQIYDIYNWRVLKLNISRLRVYLNQDYLPEIKRELASVCKRLATLLQGKKPQVSERDLNEFWAGFNACPFPPLDSQTAQAVLNNIFAPQSITFWLRISDEPLESFFSEDYWDRSAYEVISEQELLLPVNVSLYLGALEGYELPLALDAEVADVPFVIGFKPEQLVQVSSIHSLEFLPLADDFCGALGASGRGIVINYTPFATLSQQNLVATPLYKVGTAHYVTLYFSLTTRAEYNIIFPLSEKQCQIAVAKLQEAGFRIIKSENENYLFRRQDSIVHLYCSAPGKETVSVDKFLPPFLLLVANEGKYSPAERAKLMSVLTSIFPLRGEK
ncbi:MAG: hypothetical protein N2246_05485 [Candidatus Sumerlaeia bacterium]|nr:hypothetical protein [Candidatus Sumerlaeia bacterium]